MIIGITNDKIEIFSNITENKKYDYYYIALTLFNNIARPRHT